MCRRTSGREAQCEVLQFTPFCHTFTTGVIHVGMTKMSHVLKVFPSRSKGFASAQLERIFRGQFPDFQTDICGKIKLKAIS